MAETRIFSAHAPPVQCLAIAAANGHTSSNHKNNQLDCPRRAFYPSRCVPQAASVGGAGDRRQGRCPPGAKRMKGAGLLLLAAGWIIVLAAFALLPSLPPRVVFILAGMGVEVMGAFMLVRPHNTLPRERG